jgi:hypothetical protein
MRELKQTFCFEGRKHRLLMIQQGWINCRAEWGEWKPPWYRGTSLIRNNPL